jgi:hypothetical protein
MSNPVQGISTIASKESGGRLFGIVMPEVGRKLVHEECVELIRKRISEMK